MKETIKSNQRPEHNVYRKLFKKMKIGIIRTKFNDIINKNTLSELQWSAMCLNIGDGLASLRSAFFKDVFESFVAIQKHKEFEGDIEIKNKNLGGKAELALKAYQVRQVIAILQAKQYIRPDSYYFDILLGYVCGTDTKGCLIFFERYSEVIDNKATMMLRFCGDIVSYIIGVHHAEAEIAVLRLNSLVEFSFYSEAVVATAFNDHIEANKIIKEAKDLLKKIEKDREKNNSY